MTRRIGLPRPRLQRSPLGPSANPHLAPTLSIAKGVSPLCYFSRYATENASFLVKHTCRSKSCLRRSFWSPVFHCCWLLTRLSRKQIKVKLSASLSAAAVAAVHVMCSSINSSRSSSTRHTLPDPLLCSTAALILLRVQEYTAFTFDWPWKCNLSQPPASNTGLSIICNCCVRI